MIPWRACVSHLCIAVIRKFSRLALQSAGPGIDAGGLRPVEAQYGDEFYRDPTFDAFSWGKCKRCALEGIQRGVFL